MKPFFIVQIDSFALWTWSSRLTCPPLPLRQTLLGPSQTAHTNAMPGSLWDSSTTLPKPQVSQGHHYYKQNFVSYTTWQLQLQSIWEHKKKSSLYDVKPKKSNVRQQSSNDNTKPLLITKQSFKAERTISSSVHTCRVNFPFFLCTCFHFSN